VAFFSRVIRDSHCTVIHDKLLHRQLVFDGGLIVFIKPGYFRITGGAFSRSSSSARVSASMSIEAIKVNSSESCTSFSAYYTKSGGKRDFEVSRGRWTTAP
ncbi:MAG: hypothetical protein II391_02230, partial [Kiritimatiellae bacterium]|nr:hypothetical protein [Kiritimatiellia bacterium]